MPTHKHTNTSARPTLGVVRGIGLGADSCGTFGGGEGRRICAYVHGGIDADLSVEIIPPPNAGGCPDAGKRPGIDNARNG